MHSDHLSARPLPLLDLDIVRNFVAIVEHGSFSRAARQVHRTPSALSMQVKTLEATLEQRLLLRHARRVVPTPEGEKLLGYARRLLQLNHETVSQFLQAPLQGGVRLGTSDDVGTRVLPWVLSRFARSFPEVQVDVTVAPSEDLVARLDAGEVDVALITAGTQGLAGARGEVVHREALAWVGRGGGAAHQRRPLPLAVANAGCAWRKLALSALDGANVDYRIAYVSENCAGHLAILDADLAVSALPRSLVEPPLVTLAESEGLPPLGHYQLVLLRTPGATAAVDALAEEVASAFKQWSSSGAHRPGLLGG
ncbi:MAG: LysR family transcriptional regulator [Gammaproteobacteria bacterium]|uniref:LysR substrate-binding domain-containing protein n=1 Tax=unclassified Halomonas TaxID=2609666 RepID=UPI000F5F462F|nr:LysR substrate-binding domain-containing protein [Halomonas sp. YLB-10]MBR9882099.1 LysR family transcriptional regulator [Gammaproteobacteria bacterium]RQW69650.1 LysR family transcriptional regulator [Halomonas sp. YLB-10]